MDVSASINLCSQLWVDGCASYLLISEGIQELMVRAEEQISQDGVSVTHNHILIQQCSLGNGVHLNLEEDRDQKKPRLHSE